MNSKHIIATCIDYMDNHIATLFSVTAIGLVGVHLALVSLSIHLERTTYTTTQALATLEQQHRDLITTNQKDFFEREIQVVYNKNLIVTKKSADTVLSIADSIDN